jgi:hypothetical protein
LIAENGAVNNRRKNEFFRGLWPHLYALRAQGQRTCRDQKSIRLMLHVGLLCVTPRNSVVQFWFLPGFM